MGNGEDDDRENRAGGHALSNLHLTKAISHLTLALEALDRAEVPLACGYVDLALTICMDERVKRQQTGL
jgi:hypothetical protein